MGCAPVYSKRDWTLLFALAAVTLGTSLAASMQAPFYPQQAEAKGVKPSVYGLVFGIFELTCFIGCPIFGKYMGRLGAGNILKGGTLIAGCSLMSFGLLPYVQSQAGFVSLSFLVRVIEGIGTSAVLTSSMAIVVASFSDSFARVFTAIEIFQGLGFMVGPTVGGYLFEIGGFVFPFMVIGSVIVINGVIIFFTLPTIEYKEDLTKPRTAIISVLQVVPILLACFCVVIESVTLGFVAATLEPHLRRFDLSPMAVGGMFVISGIVYTLVAPLVGLFCDKGWNPKKMMIVGAIGNIAGYSFVGPFPYIPVDTSLWLVGIGLFIDGLSCSFMYVPAFVDAIQSAVKYGLQDDITTYALISGIYGSSFSLGAFIGPSVAGLLYDIFGFRRGTLLVIGVQILLIGSMTWFLCVEKKYEKNNMVAHSCNSINGPAAESNIEQPSQIERSVEEGTQLSLLDGQKSQNGYTTLNDSNR